MDRGRLEPEVSIAHPLISLEWEELPSQPVGMYSTQSAWLNGCLYFGGGWTSSSRRADATLYWYKPEQASYGQVETPIRLYGLTTYQDQVLLVGGKKYPSHELTNTIFSLEGGRLREANIPPMPTKRRGVTAISHNNILLVAGGYDGHNHLDIIELYSNSGGGWLRAESMPGGGSHMASTIYNNRVWFMGGYGQRKQVYSADLATLSSSTPHLLWETLPDALYDLSATTTTTTGELLSLGGRTSSALLSPSVSSIYCFSRSTQSWLHVGEMPVALYDATYTTQPTGEVLLIGGFTGFDVSKRVFRLCVRDELALQFSGLVLSAVQSSLPGPLERALQLAREHSLSSQQDGSRLLDFLTQPTSPHVPSSQISQYSPLMLACEYEDTKIVNVLVGNGASLAYSNKEDVTALHVACKKGNTDVLQQLVHADRSSQKLLQRMDKDGQGVLHYASTSPSGKKTLNFLLKDRALREVINYTNKSGHSPLLTACINQNVAAVEILIELPEVDATVCDTNGLTGLHHAASNDSSEIAELLLQRGCPADAQDSEGNTALHLAHRKASSSVITIFQGVDGGRVELIVNKAGQFPADIEPDDIIPPEIMKMGSRAIDLYLKALTQGSMKIPRCNFIILGEQRVGKTSVYRLLVLKGFDPNQDSTRGIDNTVVDAIDTRQLTASDWKEKDERTVEESADKEFAQGVFEILQEKLPKRTDPSPQTPLNDVELMKEIASFEQNLQQSKEPIPQVPHRSQPEERAVMQAPTKKVDTSPKPSQPGPTIPSLSPVTTHETPEATNGSSQPAGSAPKVSGRQLKLITNTSLALPQGRMKSLH